MSLRWTRRNLLLATGVAAIAAGATYYAASRRRPRARIAPRRSRPPNLLLIVTDQERHRSLLPPDLARPMLDRIDVRATRFDRFQNITALCSMARGHIYTGQHYQHTGVYENVPLPIARGLHPSVPTLGTMLQDVGYETAYFGKWHLTDVPHRTSVGVAQMRELLGSYGFEVSEQDAEIEGTHGGFRHDAATAQAAARFVASRLRAERPWFAAVNLLNPHDIMYFAATAAQRERYLFRALVGDEIAGAPQDPLYTEDLGYALPTSFGTAADRGPPAAHAIFRACLDAALGSIALDDEAAWRAHQNYYLNCLRDVDRRLGTVLDALDATNVWQDTVVLYTSDHGELGGAHGLRDKGNTVYRESAHVPLSIAHPDVRDGDTAALGCHLDLAPTLLSLAGVTPQEVAEHFPGLKGVDLSRALGSADRTLRAAGRESTPYLWDSGMYALADGPRLAAAIGAAQGVDRLRRVLDLQRATRGSTARHLLRGVYDGRYRFARYFGTGGQHLPRGWDELARRNDLELHDTQADPDERVNLAYEATRRDDVLRLAALANALFEREVGRRDAPP